MLWHNVIRSRYEMEGGGWLPCEVGGSTYRSPWKAIQRMMPIFLAHAKMKLGNGRRIKFWEDAWVERENFKDKYPNLFRLSILHNKPVSDFLDNSINHQMSWNLHLRRNVSEREIVELADLLSTLERVMECGVLEDKWVWELESSGLFTCKSLFKYLIDKPAYTPFNFHHFIWKTAILNKVKSF